jgi:hypothetical protein
MYDPYGLERASSGTVNNPFQFAGEYRLAVGTDGIYKIGARTTRPEEDAGSSRTSWTSFVSCR